MPSRHLHRTEEKAGCRDAARQSGQPRSTTARGDLAKTGAFFLGYGPWLGLLSATTWTV